MSKETASHQHALQELVEADEVVVVGVEELEDAVHVERLLHGEAQRRLELAPVDESVVALRRADEVVVRMQSHHLVRREVGAARECVYLAVAELAGDRSSCVTVRRSRSQAVPRSGRRCPHGTTAVTQGQVAVRFWLASFRGPGTSPLQCTIRRLILGRPERRDPPHGRHVRPGGSPPHHAARHDAGDHLGHEGCAALARALACGDGTNALLVSADWETAKNDSIGAYLIDGERGTGKSFALHQIVQFARESNWVVLYIPNPRSWCHEAPYVMQSPYQEDKFDIDVYGVDLLQKFLHCHGEQLRSIPVRGKYAERYYPTDKYESKPKSAADYKDAALTLRDVVVAGIRDEELACQAVCDLKEELAQTTEFPVLIAIDDYNTWFQKTVFGYEGKDVAADDISVIAALKDIGAKGYDESRKLQNGLFVAAVTENFPTKVHFKQQVDYRKIRATMRTYSAEELATVVSYYNQVSFLHGALLPRVSPGSELFSDRCSLCRQAHGLAAGVLPAHDQVAPAARVRPRVVLLGYAGGLRSVSSRAAAPRQGDDRSGRKAGSC
ncbi:unnamed protein product [Phytophthora fragariaefolia]|uniref:Small ribosomal subunit protein mS29 n=1 Tax=Phytophthora fragariaefolia TaxID=1490495 RepID=A0A9W6XLV7_9STRA|nr:unnamed protein product [Phytophthora fragariaefolia]